MKLRNCNVVAREAMAIYQFDLPYKTIKHYGAVGLPQSKLELLQTVVGLIKNDQQAVVFCENRHKANWLYDKLKHCTSYDMLVHSGDLDLPDRESILHEFSNGNRKILITTDCSHCG